MGDIGSEPEIVFKTYWTDDISKPSYNNEFIIENDTLVYTNLKYVITDLKLINSKRTIFLSDYKLIDDYEKMTLDGNYSGIYQISFNFGIENIANNYSELKSSNFDIEKGYYFMKMDFSKKNNDSIYSYNIAKKNNISKIKSFKVIIDGFNLGTGLFANEAVIGINLKNLFTKPNYINIDSLTLGSIDNKELQLKMIENAKNIFFLEQFNYD
ncbi:MAG: MbnP family protein [Polaribacter sp.]